ncbi:tether containing ubx domain for glut4, partial [Nannochloropsis gaditana CCMP526]|uniref:tether containing ubx domain for glut4 n=1 Tax=Nannochloropsis gaditana (strain CCMP526) TaxID=1093141 RepID=UPI00029F558D
MALNVLFNGRKKQIKCSPNSTMQTALEHACREHGIGEAAWTGYILLYKKGPIDLSQPFRFTGIPNNAALELSETTSSSLPGPGGSRGVGHKVRVGLQLEGGRRLTGSFDPETSLADILVQCS